MREIKFRVWDGMKMLLWGHLITNDILDVFDNKDVALMQYTGLKDKNGVEICEGDIVAYTFGRIPQTPSPIIWSEEEVGFALQNDGYETTFDGNVKNLEVIGNIYENPELIKEKV